MKKRSLSSPTAHPAETGVIHKPWAGKIHIALAFPQTYHLAMSNLGYQTVYKLLNNFEDVVCERFCLPEKAGTDLRSIEGNHRLTAFDVVAFSIAFENDYPNLLRVLDMGGLTLQAKERNASHPLIVFGGIAPMLNPEPLAPFADLILIGEAEALLPSFLDGYRRASNHLQFLKEAAETLPGAYVPSCYSVSYHPHGTLSAFTPAVGVPATVKRIRMASVARVDTSSVVLTSQTTFADSCLIEVSRGCPHGCRFCSAGFIYRPPRFRDADFLEKSIHEAMSRTSRVGLVGAAVSDFPDLSAICRRFDDQDLRLSFSSLRADALTEDLLQVLKTNRTKTATIAPEAGSQRMRNVINKGLTEDDILCATERIVQTGIPNLRLYFLIGLPSETMEDIEAILSLCRRIKSVFLTASRRQKRIGAITVNTNAFIPKPATPFQWTAMDAIADLQAKARTLRQGLKPIANIRFQMENIRHSYIQAFLSRGDRRIGDLLLDHHRHGGNWSQTLKRSSLDTFFYACRLRDENELLPWDFIETGVTRSFLWTEYQQAMTGRTSPACPLDGCTRCGACPT